MSGMETGQPNGRFTLRELFAVVTISCVLLWTCRIISGVGLVTPNDCAKIVEGLSRKQVLETLGEPYSGRLYGDPDDPSAPRSADRSWRIPDEDITFPIRGEEWIYKRDYIGLRLFYVIFDECGLVSETGM